MQRLRSFLIVGILMLCFSLPAVNPSSVQPTESQLWQRFTTPPAEAQPWTFWYWMHGAVSKPGIAADLKAMKEIGLGGAYLMTIRGTENGDYPGAVEQLTPEWWEMIRYAMQQADSLGLQLGMHISDGFALAGGPWIKPEESMQKLVWTDTIVGGGKQVLQLTRPETIADYYRDVAVYAIPVGVQKDIAQATPVISSNHPDDPHPFSVKGKSFRASEPCYIQFDYPESYLLQSIEIVPSGNNLQSQRLRLLVSDDGQLFREHWQMQPPRQGWQNTGFNYTYAVPPVRARYFRFHWTPEGTEPGSEELDAAKWRPRLSVSAIRLSSEARVQQWEAKSGLVWRIDQQDSQQQQVPALASVRTLTAQFDGQTLRTQLPAGKWRILRIGHTSTGHTNATGGAGRGLECDKFSTAAVQKQFDNWFGAAFGATDPALARRVLTHMHIDSWECGSQNWSANFAAEFRKRRGYDLMPWLPVMAGFPLVSQQKSEAVLLDVRTTINELIQEVFFATFSQNARTINCRFSAECVAPTMISDGLQHYSQVDLPMGEFWLQSPTHDKPNDMLDAISGARIYGKNIIQGEGFTQLRTTWNEHPGMLKSLLERNFAMGLNKLFFHVYVHNPYTDRAPGTTLDGIGLFFQRDQTWWKPGKAFTEYITRTQSLLQFGSPVTDIAVFTGEEMPRRSLTPDKLVPLIPGLIGDKRLKEEAERLANVGQPIREMPVKVFHSANIFDPAGWVDPLKGYAYDSFNKDALLRLARVENGRMVLPGGASYRVVIFPDEAWYSAETRAKINELRRQGVVIPGLPVVTGGEAALGVAPDVVAPDDIAWTHRSDGTTDLYFISNQQEKSRNVELSFRINDRIPQLWDPVSGKAMHVVWERAGDRTRLKLELPEAGSVFVVFEPFSPTTVLPVKLAKQQSLNAQPWELYFERTGSKLTTNTLFDWSQHKDHRIRYYSGTVRYTTQFEWDAETEEVYLQLEELNNMATVIVNGVECGTLWTPPYRTGIGHALKNGVNTLVLEVTNTWANAIMGSDSGFPPFEGIWTNGKYRKNSTEPEPSGIRGVSLLSPASPKSL